VEVLVLAPAELVAERTVHPEMQLRQQTTLEQVAVVAVPAVATAATAVAASS
jgi:hypothetical protein